ncbi:hypothetical protein NEOLEDRAFT_373994 [Neolentinus lepideus HHB14362 ss-1]|uniref:Tetratricopeptide SHNi-TPR domain-containing protein n=1 Tax=Neolentinus lepideus HHB14362 ss-1 TaxID=1314782 RepID=A0A165SIX0_9AGAM|nr:hypothetical protein NEOLEDRAFT_373994 [Neolentinus lepideus HHB14362 ss-1]
MSDSSKVEMQNATADTTVEHEIDQAKRAFALKKYEEAVDHYATALEIQTTKFGDHAPECADLYFDYGRSLLENAISQSGVLGKEQTENAVNEPDAGSSKNGPLLSFSGDAEDEDENATGEERTMDLFAEAAKMEQEEQEEEEEEGDNMDEPEDDFNAAWEVLDLARALYVRKKDDGDDVKLKLADTYITLGDVSLETEKFDQAINDYSAGLAIKEQLLPVSSRQIAEAHYKLSIVLDLTSGRLADAIKHAEKALESIEARLAEVRLGLSGQLKVEPAEEAKSVDVKGKGKATTLRLKRDDDVKYMSKAQMEAEVKDLEGLREDLAQKVEDLKTSPAAEAEASVSVPALVARALDKELAAPSAAAPVQTVVNDLTSIVKKKKAAADTNGVNGAAKRKAEEATTPDPEKKPRVEGSE